MKPKSPIAAAILLKLKKGDSPDTESEDAESEDEYDPAAEAKAGTVKQLFKALKSGDVRAGVDALESFVRACSYADDDSDESDSE